MAEPRMVFLTGFSGSGKSTIGRLVARRLGMRFVDVDEEIERATGHTVPELFEARSERSFRELEKKTVRRIIGESTRPTVVALGGGALMHQAVAQAVEKRGTLVYLSCAIRELYRRLKGVSDRPLLRVRPRADETPRGARLRRISTLLNKRLPGYRRATIILSTSRRTPEKAARVLESRLRREFGHT